MPTPDFSQYSKDQLRQILTRIDRERFPDRVDAIHARLVELETQSHAPPGMDAYSLSDGPFEIAGFWRRSGAFLIDSLLIGLAGFGLGLVLHAQFEAMGAWGRMIGFLITVGYFGTMESRMFDGRTLGKLVLDIRVVTTAGVPLSPGKAWLRAAVFSIPYFLNNANLGAGHTNFWLPAIQALLVFGLGGAMLYLYLFNRSTRQSVHDLLVGALVVRARTAPAPPLLPLWKGHTAMVAALFVMTVGMLAYIPSMLPNGALEPLRLVQHQVSRMPDVRDAGVVEGTTWATGNKRMNSLAIKVTTRTAPVDEKALAGRIAEIALTAYPRAYQVDLISVDLVHGYDIGIASHLTTRTFGGAPGDWRNALSEPGTAQSN